MYADIEQVAVLIDPVGTMTGFLIHFQSLAGRAVVRIVFIRQKAFFDTVIIKTILFRAIHK